MSFQWHRGSSRPWGTLQIRFRIVRQRKGGVGDIGSWASMVLQNYQNFIEMTSNMIYTVAFGGGLKCPHKIHLNTQWPPSPASSRVKYNTESYFPSLRCTYKITFFIVDFFSLMASSRYVFFVFLNEHSYLCFNSFSRVFSSILSHKFIKMQLPEKANLPV